METGEVIYEKVFASPRPPPKISLKHEWKRELGSEHAQRAEAGQLSRSFQSTQPHPNPNHDRTERNGVCYERASHPRFSHEGQNSILEEETNHDRTEKPVVCPQAEASQTRFSHNSTNFNVQNETKHDRTGETRCLP